MEITSVFVVLSRCFMVAFYHRNFGSKASQVRVLGNLVFGFQKNPSFSRSGAAARSHPGPREEVIPDERELCFHEL